MARIRYQKGDIFESHAQVIVNTVNCKGAMGRGLALSFKERYPAMFAVYQHDCTTGKLRIGRPTLYQESTPWILNFPTKYHWRLPSKLEYLEKGLEFLVANYKKADIRSIAFPKLGTQNGKLSWDDVGPLMAKYLSQLDINVYIYIAEGDTEYQYDERCEIKTKEQVWKQFSELALSLDRLHQEVGLSLNQAKKVAGRRESAEFKSLADLESIDGLAKISFSRIKDYINRQRYTAVELSGLTSANTPHQKLTRDTTKSPTYKRKKRERDKTDEVAVEPLFPVRELVS